ncbi:T9SS type A sorting domain-containing protein [Taibaiella sp. KBW10]|uniref:T9SS type A sorting domain-containing protein n=1 Tax=Taibaiella sp. KBW10 TaxID=2153357 RepID=UPI00131520B3|nr:T9SS type A sorting domain-containing protein [Taibaiella sp. KBW10]
MKKLLLLFSCLVTLCQNSLFAATQINTPTVSGVWTTQGSPYYIHNDLSVPINSLLTIQPGVEVIFMGNYLLDVQGKISAVGTPEQKIVFKSNDTTSWSNLALPTKGGWRGIMVANGIAQDLSTPTFANCIIRDIKNIQTYGGLAVFASLIYIDRCELFHNYTDGNLIALTHNVPNGGNSKAKFTNCEIRDNITAAVMYTVRCDSTYITNNKFYNNKSTTASGIYTRSSLTDMSTDVLIFKENELYNNTVQQFGAVVNCLQGGISYITKNKVHHNQTRFQGAISIQSKTATVEQNLITNNKLLLEDVAFCGINDGGAGLHLLGQNVLSDVAGKNDYLVRNNIIANNYSSVTGAGIWAQHCKANIVNNTIINNTVKDATGSAAINGWGSHCKLQIHNNIISNNKQAYNPLDTVYNNFRIYALELNMSGNLIDYPPTAATIYNGMQGINSNTYEHSLNLVAPPTGVGPDYNAVNANFELKATATNCINKGRNAATGYGAVDYKGQARIFDQLIDIGAIEYQKKITDTTTAIKGIDISKQVKIYPNPSAGILQLEYNHTQFSLQEIAVYTLSGQLAYHLPIDRSTQKIDISMLANGVYMMQLITDKQEVALKKLVIQK